MCTHTHTHIVLVRVSVVMMKHHDPKASREGKGLFGLHIQIIVHHWRKSEELKQNWNLEAGADAEAIEGRCLLAYFPWLAYSSCLLIEPTTTSLGMVPPTMGWALPH